MVGDALVRLAELRRQQGRFDEAEDLFARSESHSLALVGRATLALERGESEEALELAERYLRRFPSPGRTERCAGLEVAVRVHAARGAVARAREALHELSDIAARVGTRALHAAALSSEGTVAAAAGDLDAARRSFEDALDLLPASQAPFERARVQVELGSVSERLNRTQAAKRELEAALSAFRELGATADEARAEALLARLRGKRAVKTVPVVEGPLAQLSKRELEVLALVAGGLTNQEIADRLVLSEHTVHRHVTNLLRKLEVPTRAAASSLAGRYGLA
jgi:LuxR family transcriptional regulator, maltose regulon positive regulatory protein